MPNFQLYAREKKNVKKDQHPLITYNAFDSLVSSSYSLDPRNRNKIKRKGEKSKFYWYFHSWFHSRALAKEGDPYRAIGTLLP